MDRELARRLEALDRRVTAIDGRTQMLETQMGELAAKTHLHDDMFSWFRRAFYEVSRVTNGRRKKRGR